NAGMVQFKNAFLGLDEPPAPRVVTAQKCLRVSGKHNDLESVGPSPRHHTFFEMLGNFSFGDYFKEEAIRFAWELVTEVWGLPAAHLFATVYRDDDEAWELWRKISGLPEGRILRCGEEDNFWSMGDVGPCGPCSELHIDLAPDEAEVPWEEGSESGRYLELWNLVFMQYDRTEDGELTPLPNPSIDTGAGLERLAAVLQGAESNYGSDLFTPILEAAGTLAGVGFGEDRDRDVSLRVIADHLRAVTFLLADGVIPGNEGRGYVLRRILRRAVRHGLRLGLEEPFLARLVPVVDEAMAGAYPELEATREASVATVRAEEEKFLATLATGAREAQAEIEAARRRGQDRIPGERAFWLYETHGLPVDVIREIAEEERMGVDEAGFEEALRRQQERSRQASGEGKRRLAALGRILRGDDEEETEFLGYDTFELSGARVLRLAAERGPEGPAGTTEWVAATSLGAGEASEGRGVAVLDRTVFYAEAGGQVGDRGRLTWSAKGPEPGGSTGRARVTDVQKDGTGLYFHFLQVEEGTLRAGQGVDLTVAEEHRLPTQRNHTATHLLHAALREVLGEGVRQAGSLVAPDRLRFDFTFPQPVAPEELRRIEDRVNEWVLRAVPTRVREMARQEAVAAGAMALFGETYGDRVRTVEVPGFSLELCGGCHVANTGEIGPFLVTGERGIASGVRRVEAVTGEAALARIRGREELLAAVEEAVGTSAERAPEEIAELRAALSGKEKELAKLRMELVAGGGGGAAGPDGDAVEVEGIRVLAREVPSAPAGELRNLADTLRSRLGSGVVVLGTRDGGKVALVAAVSRDLTERVQAGRLVKELAARVGGGGGGRPDFAQAGGKEPEKLPEALAAAPDAVRSMIA
ncbi:MAG: alanine--tRNA ligase, partial [Thermoanaerobaculia bacterium]